MLRKLLNLIYPLALLFMAITVVWIAWPKSHSSSNPGSERYPIVLDEAEIFVAKFIPPDMFFQSEKPAGGRSNDVTTWRKENTPELAGVMGYAGYWRELPYLEPGVYEMSFDFATSAYEAYLMPKGHPERALHVSAGRPGRIKSEEIPFLKRNILTFQVLEKDKWILAANVSNFRRTYGGFWIAPRIAPAPMLSQENNLKNALNFIVAGSMIIILFYTYMLFNRRPSDIPALCLSITCLATLFRLIGIENLFGIFVTDVENIWIFELSTRMEYGAMALVTMSFLEFLSRTFTTVALHRAVYYSCHFLNVTLLSVALFTPTDFFTEWVGLYQINVILHVFCMIYITTLALKHREDGAGYMLASTVIPLITAAVDVFQSRQGGTSYVSHFGGAFFIFLQSQILAKRFALAYEQVAHLSQNLSSEVKRQTRQIRNIMDNVPEGLFTIGKDLKIQGQFSGYVEVLFPEARLNNLPDLLNFNTRIDRSSLDMMISVLLSIIGEDSIAWEMNGEHLFTELETHDQRLLTFQWHPIIQGDHVDEMLVIVRDTTELRNLRQRTLHHEQELVLISALAKSRSYHTFRDQSFSQLISIHSIWANHRLSRDRSFIRVILAMLHTLKGNARQIGFNQLARDLHDFEQTLIDLRETHGEESADFSPALETGLRIIEAELKLIDGLHRRYWGDGESREKMSEDSFRVGLSELERGLVRTAHELDKPAPSVHLLIDDTLKLSSSFQNGLLNALGHLFRNSIDHGIESAAVRRAAGKKEAGSLYFVLKRESGSLLATVSDDGPGVDVDQVRDMSALSPDIILSTNQILDLILSSGLTTAHVLSPISGRGIGMDAVKLEVENLKGRLRLVASEGAFEVETRKFIPFRVEMNFPL